MRRFFDNKFAFIAVLSLFIFALAWNTAHGTGAIDIGHTLMAPDGVLIGHCPTLPPTNAAVRIAHGPTLPPPPDDGVRIAHGPTLPPPPDDGVRIAA